MSTTTNSTTPSQRTLDFRQKYKTERCRYWFERGFCPFNQCCAFAHSDDELRGKAQLNTHYKTKVCANFKNHGYCKYGDRCQFLHLHEAPAVLNRLPSTAPIPSFPSLPQLPDLSPADATHTDHKRHQKELRVLGEYGLEVLALYLWQHVQWEWFLKEGTELNEVEGFRWEEFEQQVADYDFKRKPRLGSM